jgi:hypothetical protein
VRLGDPTGAIVDLVAALRLEPFNYTAWLDAARLQGTEFGDPTGAIATLRNAYDYSGQRRQVRIELNEAERKAGPAADPLTPPKPLGGYTLARMAA